MKLLFDQNLSPVLVEALHDLFPGSAHTEPKVIWIRRGNCSTAEIAEILRRNLAEIEAAAKDDTVRYVMLV